MVRTPLLPFDELLRWQEGLRAPAARGDHQRLAAALAHDRALLRGRLRQVLSRPEVREAVFVASPSLFEQLDLWQREPETKKGRAVESALVRYYLRMIGRATPFGLFAGWSLGATGAQTDLVLAPASAIRRHTRLDMDYVFMLVEALERDPAIRAALVYRPNSSLFGAAGQWRYAEARERDRARTYHLVTVDASEHLDAVIERARGGATLDELAAVVAGGLDQGQVSAEEARQFVEALVDHQVLISELSPILVSGDEPVAELVRQLARHPVTAQVGARLAAANAALKEIDQGGLGAEVASYLRVADGLRELPVEVELSRLFQVDIERPAPRAILGEAVIRELGAAIESLRRISAHVDDPDLRKFREDFARRYEEREVPLVEALDEELGIGFRRVASPKADVTPLLEGIAIAPREDEVATRPWGPAERLLARKAQRAARHGDLEVELTAADLAALAVDEPAPLPDTFFAMASVAGTAEGIRRGDFTVLLKVAAGPSGASLLGRFCHGDYELLRRVREHIADEEAQRPDALFAEIVHLPAGRLGNVISRPRMRAHEIPYLGRSALPEERQIPVSDLSVAIVGGRITLRSKRLGREVIPRLTSAHNYSLRTVGVYDFLCSLQRERVHPGVHWNWGALEDLPFLPRLRLGRVVVARAQWRLTAEELAAVRSASPAAVWEATQELRERHRLPQRVLLQQGDNELLIDFDNLLCCEAFVHSIGDRGAATLVEMFPGPEHLCIEGPEGRFVHEVVIPFGRPAPGLAAPSPAPPRATAPRAAAPAVRSYLPGSDWCYVKLYCSTRAADEVLRRVGPIARQAQAEGACDSWFFIRYGDPDWHLRLRFHGQPGRLDTEVLVHLRAAAASMWTAGLVTRVQVDTYEREIERFGGDAGLALSERLFAADSEAVLAIVETLEGDEGFDARWQLALRGMDQLLENLGFDLASKLAIASELRAGFGREFQADAELRRSLGLRFRELRPTLGELLDPTPDPDHWLAPGFATLTARGAAVRPLAAELRALSRSGALSRSLEELAGSYLHMHANRLLHASARAQELVLYDFLLQLYRGQQGRERRETRCRG
jgi:thiopeptide-type bacteriocin biosynthesis protein